jgi:iron complex transport system ATP-binding protein
MSDLVLDGVAVSYGSHRALASYSDRVRSGEWVGVIGPNGAGKSSLLKAIAGLVPSAGSISVGGVPLAGPGVDHRRRAQQVAYVAQEPLIPDDMGVFDYVLLGRTPYVGYFGIESAADRAVVADVIDRLRLGDFAGRMLGSMSGGERQRAVLARALAQEAPVLLLDEPTSALDTAAMGALERAARSLADDGMPMVWVTHDMRQVERIGDGCLVIVEGRIADDEARARFLTGGFDAEGSDDG